MPGDRAKSRERKLKRIQEQWMGQSWHIRKRCELCGFQFVVNNYPDKKPRTPRIFKRICCPWCEGRRGKLRMAEHILVERMADLRCLNNWDGDPFEDDPFCKCVRCTANKVVISQLRRQLREDPASG